MHDIARLLQRRLDARAAKNWTLSDAIRDELDALGAFVIDQKDGTQKTLRLDDDFFRHMEKVAGMYGITFGTRRKYVEWRVKQDIRAEQLFNAWLYSMQQSIAAKKKHDIP